MSRKQLIRVAIVLLLVVCVWAHVSELFDTWDNTLQTGNDLESTVVLVALCLGAALLLGSTIFRLAQKLVRSVDGAGLPGIIEIHCSEPACAAAELAAIPFPLNLRI